MIFGFSLSCASVSVCRERQERERESDDDVVSVVFGRLSLFPFFVVRAKKENRTRKRTIILFLVRACLLTADGCFLFLIKTTQVRDMAQADFGRMEIELAEVEMPGLMSCVTEFGPSQPLKGANISLSLIHI